MTLSIENEHTLQIIKRALDQQKTDLTSVGKVFDSTTEEGKAILGNDSAMTQIRIPTDNIVQEVRMLSPSPTS